ncbi:MAG: 1-(5-phosphoribosyl)-5-[(5-phosphoribosylamino)methylideneamino] imidazole-4-carboxamide isomerase [Ignavibacteriales bacterium]|nr:1-(5-phosphoribosyl)-5-[(5-phosphoribosylamino)methylideneamino] imidazole-4-carboxamide isomerase [Ignavibacteriales bacterium]MCF8435481.1 1-(5-phosphoribosyl)-5-[(5-phosphoribosylamino)methylideneamino] imidazole-4-carboxamide isomerase [Ignavibacteriales bacterium]
MSKILVIPSIDIQNGHTVRVVQGIPELNCKEYGNDPVEMAMIWRTENAKCLHVVDFDSAISHSHSNFPIIEEMCASVVIPIQMGGGIHNLDDAKAAFGLGIFRLIIGSLLFENKREFMKILEHFGPLKVIPAIDVVGEQVVIHGRRDPTGQSVLEYIKNLNSVELTRIVVTDVLRNGMLEGPNLQLSKKVFEQTGLKITHSGGIGGFSDLRELKNSEGCGIDSVIIGRALYENKFPCQKIWRVAEKDFV